jgi:quercetin dioxygenase-like cupin family protein
MNTLTYFNKLRVLPLLIAPMLVALATFTPVPARATPGCGVTTVDLIFGASPPQAAVFASGLLNLMCNNVLEFNWNLKMKVKGDSDLFVTEHTYVPGGQTGWHTHAGPSLITVVEGTLTVYHDDCTSTTYSAGESFTDIGCGDVHNVVNEAGAEAKDVAVQIVPHNAGRRIDVPDDPGCPQVPPCP